MVQWRGRRESSNVEDRSGEDGSGGGFSFPGQRGRLPFPMPGSGGRSGGGIGILGLLIIVGLMFLFGVDPRVILGGGGMQQPRVDTGGGSGLPKIDIPGLPGSKPRTTSAPSAPGGAVDANADIKSFVKVMLADTEDVWTQVFQEFGQRYSEPQLVFFTGGTQTACGPGMSAMGPFYCPLDQKVYIDTDFYEELRNRFGAPGDFAQAYVIAHEVGHHVQLLLGIAEKVQEYKQRVGDERLANAAQVRMELQADCLAGVWANNNNKLKGFLEQGDIEEGLNAAQQIGDDMIQRKTQGHIVPDAFTHGTSEQRARWFKLGLQSGNLQDCDTFNADPL